MILWLYGLALAIAVLGGLLLNPKFDWRSAIGLFLAIFAGVLAGAAYWA